MRFMVVLLVLCAMVGSGRADSRWRIQRVLEVADELKLDEQQIGRVFAALATYERDRDKLHGELAELLAKIATTTDANAADHLLDDSLAKQRALLGNEQRLVGKLRAMLPAKIAARARVMLLSPYAATSVRNGDPASEPLGNPEDLIQPASPTTTPAPTSTQPPAKKGPCDPFSTMHGCPF